MFGFCFHSSIQLIAYLTTADVPFHLSARNFHKSDFYDVIQSSINEKSFITHTDANSTQQVKNENQLPPLPTSSSSEDKRNGQGQILLPVPQEIRPTLAKFRVEVLFWGLRELRRIHWMSVEKPRVDVECGGKILHSHVIQSAKLSLIHI